MADFENPFADPESQNLFQDPSVQQAAYSGTKTQPLSDFNPFASEQPFSSTGANYGSQAQTINTASQQPAKLQPSSQLSTAASGSQWDEAELQRRQEELDRRAAELERREQELKRSLPFQERVNNFPPLPSWFPLKPCFYQDFNVDIPVEFQKIVRTIYYLWLAYSALLFVNIFGSLTYLIGSVHNQVDSQSGATFALSIIFAVMFTPCSFVCWYRPAYNAFRSDSSFSFFAFFFIFFFQFCYSILQFLGMDGWGTVGLITSIKMFGSGSGGAVVAGVIMLIIGILFGILAVLDFIVLLQVYRIYRSSGASFAKAQEEFASGIFSNRTVQQTAGNLAASAVRNTVASTNR
jgi:hypothetical protein